nr:hypothetical protein [Tanacetum cinerariifolium]
MKGSEKNNETLIALTPILSVKDKRYEGAPFTQGIISSIPIGGSISPEGFLPSILLMVIMVVIVVVILVVVVVVIVGVVIVVMIIGVPQGLVPSSRDMIHNELSNSTKIDSSKGQSGGGVVDLTGDEDPINEDGDTRMGDSEVLVSLGEITSRGKKSQESNIVASYAGMTSIYGLSCKGEKTIVAKRYLVKSSEELGELFLDVAGK